MYLLSLASLVVNQRECVLVLMNQQPAGAGSPKPKLNSPLAALYDNAKFRTTPPLDSISNQQFHILDVAPSCNSRCAVSMQKMIEEEEEKQKREMKERLLREERERVEREAEMQRRAYAPLAGIRILYFSRNSGGA